MPLFVKKSKTKETSNRNGGDRTMASRTPTKNERHSKKPSLRAKVSGLLGSGQNQEAKTNKKKSKKWKFGFQKSNRKAESDGPNVTVITPSTVGSESQMYHSSDRDGFEIVLNHSPTDSSPITPQRNDGTTNNAHEQISDPAKNTSFDYCPADLSDFSVMGTDCVSPLADWGNFVSLLVSPPLEVVKDYVFGNDDETNSGKKKNVEQDASNLPFDEIDDPTVYEESLSGTTTLPTANKDNSQVHPHGETTSMERGQLPGTNTLTRENSVCTVDVIPFKTTGSSTIDEQSQKVEKTNIVENPIIKGIQEDLPHEQVYNTEFTLRFLRVRYIKGYLIYFALIHSLSTSVPSGGLSNWDHVGSYKSTN